MQSGDTLGTGGGVELRALALLYSQGWRRNGCKWAKWRWERQKGEGASGQGREAQLLVKRCFTSQLPPLNAAGWHSRRLLNLNRFHRGA
jgi:hypothetical protein